MSLSQNCQYGQQGHYGHGTHQITNSRGWNKGINTYEDAANSISEGPKYTCIAHCHIIQWFRQYKLNTNADTIAGINADTNTDTNADTKEHSDSSADINTDNAINNTINAAIYDKI